MKRLIAIQHCQSEQHRNGMVGGATDWPLTKLGMVQARSIGERLKEKLGNDHGYRMYASDLSRAKQTAEIIAEHLDIVHIHFRENLREQNLGMATGKSQQWFGENKIPCPEDRPLIYHRYFPDAETGEEVYNRTAETVLEIEDKENVIVVAHGGSLQMFTAAWLGIPVKLLERMAISGVAGGVSFLSQRDDGVRVLKQWCDLSYREIR